MPSTTHQRGFSLIELMVGMLVSMICMLAMMAAFAVYEGKKRTTTSGNDAQQNGSYALYTLERQLRTAGSSIVQGLNHGLWGCPVTAYTDSKKVLPASSLPAPFASSGWPLTTRLVPVLIAAGGKTGPDVIGVVSGNSALQVFSVAVSSTPSSNGVVVSNALGFFTGDYVAGTLSDGSCAMAHIVGNGGTATQVPDTTLVLDTSNSPATGLQTATNLFDLGPSPTFTLYGVDPASGSLVSWDLLQRKVENQPAAVTPIADGIVMMKALYGIQTTGSSNLTWVPPTGNWAINKLTAGTAAAAVAMSQIKAIRVAVVAQSRLPERAADQPASGGDGNHDLQLTLFRELPGNVQYSMTRDPQFRYQVYETTVPVRNAMVSQFY